MTDILCPDADLLSTDQLATLIKLLPQLEAWIKAVKTEALKLATEGRLKGYKLVEGRSLRKWIDDAEAEKILSIVYEEEVLYTRSFTSVAQAEKLVGKRAFREIEKTLVTRTIGKPVLAPLSDKRTAVHAAAEFKPIT